MSSPKSIILDQNGNATLPAATALGTQSIRGGGIVNPASGLGGYADKGNSSYFYPTINRARAPFEVMYVESWAAAKFIDIPIDDMFIRGRSWAGKGDNKDEGAIEKMEEAERNLKSQERLAMAMKAGRLHGGGLAVMMTTEASLDTPLMVEKIKEGDFAALLCFDRFDCSIQTHVADPFDPDYGKPDIYLIQPRPRDGAALPLYIHASRILRFDGKQALSSDSWCSAYDVDWGVSELIPAITELTHDASAASAVAHLMQEASIPVVKTEGFANSLSGKVAADEVSPHELGTALNFYKSIYRTMMIDKTDDFERVSVTFAGLPELLDKFAERLAAIAGIPITRFLSQSPAGMNSTGESDMKNYAMHVAALQIRLLDAPMRKLDAVLARHVGLKEPPEWKWNGLFDLTDMEQAEVAKGRAEPVIALFNAGIIDENEARETITDWSDPVLGAFDPMPEADLEKNQEPEPVVMPGKPPAATPAKPQPKK